jgi:tetratricopeptide (TPR) repeat protein
MTDFDQSVLPRWTSLQEQGDNARTINPLKAESCYLKAVAEVERRQSLLDYLVKSLMSLANFYEDCQRFSEAERACLRVLAICQNSATGSNMTIAEVSRKLGSMYLVQRRDAEAEIMLRKALAYSELTSQPADRTGLYKLGVVLKWQRRYEEAKSILVKAQELYASKDEKESDEYIDIVQSRADISYAEANFEQAYLLYAYALILLERKHGAKSKALGPVLEAAATAAQHSGRQKECDEYRKRAKKLEPEPAASPD